MAHWIPRIGVLLLTSVGLVFGSGLGTPRTGNAGSLDVEQALAAMPGERSPDTVRIDGSLRLCARKDRFEIEIVTTATPKAEDCTDYPVHYFDETGNPPWVDLEVDGESFAAQQVHLFQRGKGWYLLVEGHHDSSVVNEHRGTVFGVVRYRRLNKNALVRACSAFVSASDEDNFVLHKCIRKTLHAQDLGLILWLEGDACLIDYSSCR